MVTPVVAPEAARSGATDTRAPDETDSPAPRRRWACAFPMTGVRYYRFLPEVPDTTDVTGRRETTEPDRRAASPKVSGAAVRGAT